MKIAYCFSGLIRNLDYSCDKWLSIINKYPGDIYGSFWDITDRNSNDTADHFIKKYKRLEFKLGFSHIWDRFNFISARIELGLRFCESFQRFFDILIGMGC